MFKEHIKNICKYFKPIHPNQHIDEEIKLIKNYKRNNKDTGLVVLWVKLREAGYTRTIQGLYHVMQRLGIYQKAPSKKKEREPSEWVTGTYPGEKVQIDVKYVPTKCISRELQKLGEKYYQYTAIDEYTRIRYTWFTNEHSTYMSSEFARRVKKTLKEIGIEYKTIKPYTPKENGRVERSHRKDQERFYYKRMFYSLEDLRNLGAKWRKEYNNFPMRPLGWLSPREKLLEYQAN